MERARVIIFDTTLRDGEQSPGCSMNPAEKLRLALQLERLGVDVIEAGFPISSQGDFESVQMIANEVRGPSVAALCRAAQMDIERGWEAIQTASRPRLHVFLASSDIHLKYKLRMTREQCLTKAFEMVSFARSLCPDVEFSPEDATRTDLEFLCTLCEAVVEAGATTLNLPDTVGYTTPADIASMMSTVRAHIPRQDVVLSSHCHNDLGMAVANSLAAVQAGARQIECTINGVGERAGNCSLEEVVMAMRVRQDAYPFETGIQTDQIYPTSSLFVEITSALVQPNKAIVGRNAFAHESGIHQDGVLKNPLTYEIMTPASVGVPDSKLVLGKHSGRSALNHRCEELGYQFSRRDLDSVYRRFVDLADKIKVVEDKHLLSIIHEEIALGVVPTMIEPNRSAQQPAGTATRA